MASTVVLTVVLFSVRCHPDSWDIHARTEIKLSDQVGFIPDAATMPGEHPRCIPMHKKPSKSALSIKENRRQLSPDEWDFRMFDQETDLCTAIEYEYLRSSFLRPLIVDWHREDFSKTQFANSPDNANLLRTAGLLKFPKGSPLDKLCQHCADPFALSFDQALELKFKAYEQFPTLPKSKCSIGEAIERIFNGVDCPNFLDSALLRLEGDLPRELAEFNAQKIALKFDCFPEPWLAVQRAKGGIDYLKRRCFTCEYESKAMWEIGIHNEDPRIQYLETAMVGVEPFIEEHMFLIDWKRSVGDILKCFTDWLNKKHLEARPGAPKTFGWLKRLSAYRLREDGMTYREAWEMIKDHKDAHPGANFDALPESQHNANWTRDVKEVKRALSVDFITEIRQDFKRLV